MPSTKSMVTTGIIALVAVALGKRIPVVQNYL